VSGAGSPAHPRAARCAARAAGQFVDGSKSPGAGPLLPAALPLRALPEHSGHPGGLDGIHDALIGGGPIRSRPAHRPGTNRQPFRAAPRQATTPGLHSLRALTRVPSCAPVRASPSEPRPVVEVALPFRSKLALLFCSVSVVNVTGGELRLKGDRIPVLVEPALDTALALAEPKSENGLHLKSFCASGVGWPDNSPNTANRRRISSFPKNLRERERIPRLFKA
jgi:hypothetical protein